ncbi:MAG: ROK family protein [bacterium]|nr:ROK family protein [bacterium]
MPRLSLGLDVGGTNIKAVLLDGSHRVVRRGRWRTASFGTDVDSIINGLCRCTEDLLRREKLVAGELKALGLACAGLINREEGLIEECANLAPWVGMPLGALLSERLGIRVALENDVNALAWGEWKHGAGRGARNMLCIAIGTGVGGGMILEGELHTGHRGFGGELGHMVINSDGRKCICGNRGCLEAYIGGQSIIRSIRRALARKRPGWRALAHHLGDADPTPALLTRAAKAGDKLALELYDEVGRALGVAISSYINIFAPELIVLAGGVAAAGNLILAPARREATARLMDPSTQTLAIRCRTLGNDGAAIGVALLAEERIS